jgi:hypothetical protein
LYGTVIEYSLFGRETHPLFSRETHPFHKYSKVWLNK